MLPVEVDTVLSLLVKHCPGVQFGKHFLSNFSQRKKCDHVTVNYPENSTLGVGVATMIKFARQAVQRKRGEYTFSIGSHFVVLRKSVKTIVVDFDLVNYDPVSKKLTYKGGVPPEEKSKNFADKICTLDFDPYFEQSNTDYWFARREALLWYINSSWKILVLQGNELSFASMLKPVQPLNPFGMWTFEKKSNPLSHENFLKEFNQLLEKYKMTPPANSADSK